jgi:hypothetical protein
MYLLDAFMQLQLVCNWNILHVVGQISDLN